MQVKDSKILHFFAIKMPKVHKSSTQTMELLVTKISKKIGVSLKDFNGMHIMTLDNKTKQNKAIGFSPLYGTWLMNTVNY
jgi:hypothetical protein